MDMCQQSNCPFYDKKEGCTHPSAPLIAECDILPCLPREEKEPMPEHPMYMRFTFRDEWRHMPANEVFPIWTLDDFKFAIYAFRELHKSQGALVAFITEDLIDWKVWGNVPDNKSEVPLSQYLCFCTARLYIFKFFCVSSL